MNVETYLARKRSEPSPKARAFCTRCRLAKVVCDCHFIRAFETETDFIILMHPEESRRRIATGRLTHLTIKNSQLIVGESFQTDPSITRLLNDPARQCVVLYPGRSARNLSDEIDRSWIDSSKKLTVLVLDGTWRTAKKMLHLSPRLQVLEQICFTPPRLSTFRIRKQPAPICFSTLEAVHHLIKELEPAHSDSDQLLTLFDAMVERQINYAAQSAVAKRSERL